MIADHSSAELGNVILKINEILRLLMSCDIIKVNILVAPLKVMNNPFIRKLLLNNEDVLEKVNDSLFDIKVVKLGYHRLLILQISLISVN